jgi:hypothetical protein
MLASYNPDSARTHMRLSRGGDLNTPSIEYFLVKDHDGSMPGSDASVDLTTARSHEQGLPYTVNLPSNKLRRHGPDHAIAEIVYV